VALAAGPLRAARRLPEPFPRTLADARLAARGRNVPLLIVALKENEESSDRLRRNTYVAPEFVRACQDAVLLLANDGEHGTKPLEEEHDGVVHTREVCAQYEVTRCGDHQRNMDHVFREFKVDGALGLPLVLVLRPDGQLHGRFQDQHSLSVLLAALAEVRELAGPGISAADHARARELALRAARAAEAGDHPGAFRAWSSVGEIARAGALSAEAAAGAESARAAMRAAIEAAEERLRSGQVAEGFRALLVLEPSFAGTPLARELTRSIQAAERHPDWKDEIRALRRADEAEGLWQEVARLEADGKASQAERVARRILKGFGDTPAAERVRARYPGLEDGD
jgi:hypothetical protein